MFCLFFGSMVLVIMTETENPPEVEKRSGRMGEKRREKGIREETGIEAGIGIGRKAGTERVREAGTGSEIGREAGTGAEIVRKAKTGNAIGMGRRKGRATVTVTITEIATGIVVREGKG
jgi:hypothetical protein